MFPRVIPRSVLLHHLAALLVIGSFYLSSFSTRLPLPLRTLKTVHPPPRSNRPRTRRLANNGKLFQTSVRRLLRYMSLGPRKPFTFLGTHKTHAHTKPTTNRNILIKHWHHVVIPRAYHHHNNSIRVHIILMYILYASTHVPRNIKTSFLVFLRDSSAFEGLKCSHAAANVHWKRLCVFGRLYYIYIICTC